MRTVALVAPCAPQRLALRQQQQAARLETHMGCCGYEDLEVAARGINGKAKVQGSAMHSKTPGDIDMEIVVDQAEFDRLANRFLDRAPKGKEATLRASIAKKKIPSYEFYPDHDPSIASAAKKFTQGADGKPLDVQATLIVGGSDFDLGPFL